MNIEKLNLPYDLKKLTLDELNLLAKQVRSLILEVISKKGGHLASSLGAVELCLALHYCLNTPEDDIIFDVGHQTYAHKILTQRKDSFATIREKNGLSGFPDFRESAYDVYLSGHASTAISWAQGLAEAKRIKKSAAKTVAIVGDGSLTGGMCFEALNNCGHVQSDVLVIFNHNDMSISASVGALSKYFTKLLSAPVYNRIKNELEKFLEYSSLGKRLAQKARKFEEALKGLIVPGIFFEELGFRYFGPIDGHDLSVLIPTLKNVSALAGPRLLHVVTKKGKGYRFAESNPEAFHSAGPFNLEKGNFLKNKVDGFGEVMAKQLVLLAKTNPKITAITAAMPCGTGLDIFARSYPDRFFDVGIAEAHAVGLASGLAKKGLKPVVAIYSSFLQRAYDQIIHDVALQNLNVIFVLDRAGSVGEDGPTHHGMFDIPFLRIIPNMICLAPKDKEELEDMLAFALTCHQPVSIRYPRGKAFSLNNREKISLGQAQVLRQGQDLCIVAVGNFVQNALVCADILAKQGVSVKVVNARFIKPLDTQLFKTLANQFRLIATLEDGAVCGGFGSALLEFFQGLERPINSKIINFGFPDKFIPYAGQKELQQEFGLDGVSLAESLSAALKELGVCR